MSQWWLQQLWLVLLKVCVSINTHGSFSCCCSQFRQWAQVRLAVTFVRTIPSLHGCVFSPVMRKEKSHVCFLVLKAVVRYLETAVCWDVLCPVQHQQRYIHTFNMTMSIVSRKAFDRNVQCQRTCNWKLVGDEPLLPASGQILVILWSYWCHGPKT